MSPFFVDNLKFWIAVCVGLAIKFALSEEKQTRKKATAGIVCGAACAFYGSDIVMEFFSVGSESRELVVIGLVITGEHVMRAFVEKAPEIGVTLINALKGKL